VTAKPSLLADLRNMTQQPRYMKTYDKMLDESNYSLLNNLTPAKRQLIAEMPVNYMRTYEKMVKHPNYQLISNLTPTVNLAEGKVKSVTGDR